MVRNSCPKLENFWCSSLDECTPNVHQRESSKGQARVKARLAGMGDSSVKFTLGWDQQLVRNSCPKLENIDENDKQFEEGGKQQREIWRKLNDSMNKSI
jgi:hypothetical protein